MTDNKQITAPNPAAKTEETDKPKRKKRTTQAGAHARRVVIASELRKRLDGVRIIKDLSKIDGELSKIDQELANGVEVIDESTGEITRQYVGEHGLETAKVRIVALKTRADIGFKKLRKVLPDLAALELSSIEAPTSSPAQSLLDAIKKASIIHDGEE